MKKYSAVILILCLAVYGSLQAGELGKRYLKLGNTYRESGNYSKAEEYLKQGKKLVSNDEYWSATAHEFFGYLYRDMVASGDYNSNSDYFLALAKENMEKALSGFRKAVKQPDGSPIALSGLMESIEKINGMMAGGSYSAGAKAGINPLAKTGNSKIVNLDNSKLKAVPNDLPASMENFSAVNNRIKELSALLGQYLRLQYVNLKGNRINSVDNGINGLKGVKVLNLSDNRIKTVPPSIAELKQLEVLDLSHNKLKDIPSVITSLKNLKVLDISGNKIPFTQISTLIKNMPMTNIIFDKYERVEDEDETEE